AGIPEDDEVLSEQAYALRTAAGLLEVRGEEYGKPVLTHQLSHRRSLPGLRQQIIFLFAQHAENPFRVYAPGAGNRPSPRQFQLLDLRCGERLPVDHRLAPSGRGARCRHVPTGPFGLVLDDLPLDLI